MGVGAQTVIQSKLLHMPIGKKATVAFSKLNLEKGVLNGTVLPGNV